MTDNLQHYEDTCIQLTLAFHEARPLTRAKPLIGGVFGVECYSLCSVIMKSAGLDEVSYLVRHDPSGTFISTAFERGESLGLARMAIGKMGPARLARMFQRFTSELEQQIEALRLEREAAMDAARKERGSIPVERSIPKRRRAIFDASGGKCHYCSETLTLDGRWHIEHKMPRALMGGSEQSNLVASCVTCNLRKSDSTDLEFQARLAGEKA
jgi:5-methylcytosine-specific restriction endonuclease McrA